MKVKGKGKDAHLIIYVGQSADHKDKDKDSFIGPQEFVVGYFKAPEQP